MTSVFTDFERWALALPVPWLGLKPLTAASDFELAERWDLLSMDIGEGDEKELASTLIRMGSLTYLEALCRT